MAHRGEGLLEEEARSSESEDDVIPLPERRKARPGEATVLCLGLTAAGKRCGRARGALYCSEHENDWLSLTPALQESLKALAEGDNAYDAKLWDTQFGVVSTFMGKLRSAAAYTEVTQAAVASAAALSKAQQDLDDALEQGDRDLQGARDRVPALSPADRATSPRRQARAGRGAS